MKYTIKKTQMVSKGRGGSNDNPPVNFKYQNESMVISGKRNTIGINHFLSMIFLQSKDLFNSSLTPAIFCFLYTRIDAAIKGQKVISALIGSFIGNILVKSFAIAPRIKNGMERIKTNKKNFNDDLFVEVIILNLI